MTASHGPKGDTPSSAADSADQQRASTRRATDPKIRAGFALLTMTLAFGLAFGQRSCGTHRAVFTDQGTLLQGVDAWYHMRLIEYEATRGIGSAARLQVDPYLAMPEGSPILVAPLFDEMAGLLARVALGGRIADPNSASDLEIVRRAAAWLPVLLGSLLVFPIYVLATRLWGATAGYVSLVCYLAVPGALLDRSLLGATDHHVAETFFSTLTVTLLALSIRSGGRSSRLLAILAGCALAAFQMSWIAGLLLPMVLAAWLVFLLLVAALPGLTTSGRDRCSDAQTIRHTLTAVAWCAAVAWLLLVLRADGTRIRWMGVHATASLFVMAGIVVLALRRPIRLYRRTGWLRWSIAALVLFVLAGATLWILRSDAFGAYLVFLRDRPGANTVAEASRLFRTGQGIVPLWREFGMGWLVAVPGILLIAWRAVRRRSAAELLLVVWTATTVLLTFAQVRFAYYLAPITAWAAGALVSSILLDDGSRSGVRRSLAARVLAVGGVLALFVAPNARITEMRSSSVPHLSQGWRETLEWLRIETPEPFSDKECFYGVDPPEDPRCRPEYGVLAWWDYGYWIIQKARRVPYTNPTQHRAGDVAGILLSEPSQALRELRRQRARYVVVDGLLSVLRTESGQNIGKFTALPAWAGLDVTRFVEPVVMVDDDGQRRVVFLFKEAFFRSFVTRLLANSAEASEPREIPVVQLVDDGLGLRTVRQVRFYDDEAEARRFLAEKDPSAWLIASFDALQSPLALPDIDGVLRVFSSQTVVARTRERAIPEVQVFEITAMTSGIVPDPDS